ncbi:MAG: hypothetical protein BBJ57_02090 [Desulfobacterales bacterium PC51MH44]|nr:MAG: hypothetical protein BBJ57_02090 [Desulfobacterales bacterium PC51MH44]
MGNLLSDGATVLNDTFKAHCSEEVEYYGQDDILINGALLASIATLNDDTVGLPSEFQDPNRRVDFRIDRNDIVDLPKDGQYIKWNGFKYLIYEESGRKAYRYSGQYTNSRMRIITRLIEDDD